MKKFLISVLIACFTLTTAVPSFADYYRARYRTIYPPRLHSRVIHHETVCHYTVHHDYDWEPAAIALGVGALAGAVLGALCSSPSAPPAPPPRRVYRAPTQVVNSPPPVVVEQPTPPVRDPVRSGTVSVAAPVLNVRSGPGMEHPIIDHVYEGDLLEARGSASAWLYVKLPDGGFGWVMADYVAASARG